MTSQPATSQAAMTTPVNARTNNTHSVSPSTHRSFKGYISVVISDNGNAHDIEGTSSREHLIGTWASSCSPDRGKETYAASIHRRSSEVRFTHLHLLYWHYRDCPATSLLWKFAREHGYTFRWKEVFSIFHAYHYVLWGNGDKTPISSRRGNLTQDDQRGLPGASEDSIPCDRDGVPFCYSKHADTVRQDSRSRTPLHMRSPNGDAVQQWDEIQELPEISSSQEKGLSKLAWIKNLVKQYGCNDFQNYNKMIVKTQNQRAQMIHATYSLQKDYKAQVKTCIEFCKIDDRDKTWLDILNEMDESVYALQSTDKYYDVDMSAMFVAYWCRVQGLVFPNFVERVRRIIDREDPKQNIIYLYGQVNAFKSNILKSIQRSNKWYSTISGLSDKNIRFAFASCVNSRCVLIEECRATDETQDQLKNIMGGDTHSTDVKYEDWTNIDRVPILLASNAPIWSGCSIQTREDFCRAVKVRGFIHKCKTVPNGANFKRGINPSVWKYLQTMPKYFLEGTYETKEYKQFERWIGDGDGLSFEEWKERDEGTLRTFECGLTSRGLYLNGGVPTDIGSDEDDTETPSGSHGDNGDGQREAGFVDTTSLHIPAFTSQEVAEIVGLADLSDVFLDDDAENIPPNQK